MPIITSAQILYPATTGVDSITFTFKNSDSLSHFMVTDGFGLGGSTITLDTIGCRLWQIGNTHKPIFTSGALASHGIMTDTLNPYPNNKNEFFQLKMVHTITNVIVDVWHRYQTDSLHAGGIIEYSTDTGLTWINITDCEYVYKDKIYTQVDTLLTGQPSFMGNSNGQVLSRFQFINCVGQKTTNTACNVWYGLDQLLFVRFRFLSDATVDTLPGWKIDSIRVVNPGCIPGQINETTLQQPFAPYPNPSINGVFYMPEIKDAQDFTLEVYNAMGQRLLVTPYQNRLVMKGLPKGVYYFRASNGQQEYSCNLLLE